MAVDPEEIERRVSEVFVIENIFEKKGRLVFTGYFITPDEKEGIEYLKIRLREIGLVPSVFRINEFKYAIEILKEEKLKIKDFLVPLILFILTVFTTMFAGAIQEAKSWDEFVGNFPHSMLKGIPFSFSLLSILLAHEMGHFIMSRKFGIRATLPHFIPVPHPLVGTFGAFIKMKSIIPDKKALLYIGAAGPLAGIMVAIPVTIYGLSISTPIPIPEGEGIFLGDPLLFKILSFIFAPPVPEGYTLQISTVAFAGWIGFFVTALNLLPFSQLDGGHIIYALLGEKSILISYMLFPFLILAGFTWPGWFFWAFLLLILGLRHPPTIDRITKPEKREKIIGIICIIVFILTFHPVPFKVQT